MTMNTRFTGGSSAIGRSAAATALALMLALPIPAAGAELKPLPIALPSPAFQGTPTEIPLTEHMEPPTETLREPFLAPAGTRLLSLHKPVTASDRNPINGNLELVTDGIKEAGDSNVLELRRRLQWVQVDLGQPARLVALILWHAHDVHQFVHDVIVQVADDVNFTQNVRILFNNDYDNSAGLGVGKDKEYLETHEGRLIEAKAERARYVRWHSNGSTYTALNRFTEIEVWGITE